MTTEDSVDGNESKEHYARLEANLARIDELTHRMLNALAHKKNPPPALQAPSQDLYMRAASAYVAEMMQNPAKIFEQQIGYWGKTLQHYVEAQQAFAQTLAAPPDEGPKDKRFASELWETHPYFNYIKQQYLLNAEAVHTAVGELEGIDRKEKRRLEYFSKQIIEMFSPSNFLATNPEALTRAVETEGESLVKGLENLVRDLEANEGELLVTLADRDAFTVGENIATTPGEVVYRNRLFELIQYSPTTEQVHERPLVIFPPWINKFYILDLKEKNSLIKYIVDQGFTLFVVSWVNPDPSYRDTGLGDYVEEGFLTAIEQVKEICGVKTVNAVGYCIAGTTLSITLGLMKKRDDRSINSATFFTTLTDFSDQGEFEVFLTDDFVDGIEREAWNTGVLESFYMTRTFSYLRSTDLIFQPAVKSYMMGEAPPAFDLLYWNGDGTNLPAQMASDYLRGLCQQNLLATEGFPVAGETVQLGDITVPVCAIACETDHIADWKNSYRGIGKMRSKDKTFILSESGHIAGIVNPPSKKKYGHYLHDDLTLEPEAWKEAAAEHEGSWWPVWTEWLGRRSGKMVEAREPGDSSHPPIAPAPGTYVRVDSESVT